MTQANLEKTKDLTIELRPSGVAFIVFDTPGKENFLSSEVMERVKEVVLRLGKDNAVKAVAIMSGKDDSFISGADLHEIMKLDNEEKAHALCRRGHDFFNAIASMSKPIVAGIHGRCLGGGLEMTLCCTRRIATESAETQLGLPEVKLGLIPGLGGTQRLPRLIDLKSAVELILSGDPVPAAKALELGLVDEVVPKSCLADRLEEACLQLIEERETGERILPVKHVEPMTEEKQASFFKMMERSIRMRTKGKYPAPVKALEVIRKGLNDGLEAGLAAEAKAFAELSVGAESANLIFLFFTTEFYKQSAAAQAAKQQAEPIRSIAIVGSGLMGTTIAQTAAVNGYKVHIRAAHRDRQKLASEKVSELIERFETRAGRSEQEIKDTLSRVHSVESDDSLKDVDLVIEACVENIDDKIKVLDQIIPHLKDNCIIATNTSSLSVDEIASRIDKRLQVVGLHFFHPVEKMPLVEVIATPSLKRDSSARVMSFLSDLGKIPLSVKDSTCFLTNRLLCTYIVEAARLTDAQVPYNWIEEAMLEFGMPMGPWAVTDEVGYDVARLVSNALWKSFGERFTPPPVMDGLERIKIKGKKTGYGISLYDENGKNLGYNPDLVLHLGVRTSDEKLKPEEAQKIAEQVILPMIDEAARCLSEKVVRRPRELDLGTVIGIGFPPFRGGLLRYADSIGIEYVRKRLEEIYASSEPRRTVSDYLLNMEKEGRTFYSRAKESEE